MDASTLANAIQSSLNGDPHARQWLEQCAIPGVSSGGGPLLALWDSALTLITHSVTSSSPSVPSHVGYFAASMLKRNVRQQWCMLPPPVRAQLSTSSWGVLTYVASSSGLRVGALAAHPGFQQLVSVVVSQAVCQEADEAREAARQRIHTALDMGTNGGLLGAALALKVLTNLAEDAAEGFGGQLGTTLLPEAGRAVCALGVRSLCVEQSSDKDLSMDAGDVAAMVETGAKALARWWVYGGEYSWSWGSKKEVATALAEGVARLLHVAGAAPAPTDGPSNDNHLVAVRRRLSGAVTAIEELVEEVLGLKRHDDHDLMHRLPPPPTECPQGNDQAAMEEALTSMTNCAMALLTYAHKHSEDEELLLTSCRVLCGVIRGGKYWAVAHTHAHTHDVTHTHAHTCDADTSTPHRALTMLLHGTDSARRPISTACLEVWLDVHKVPFPQRDPVWRHPLYQHLLTVLLNRAQLQDGFGEGDDEEPWQEYREQILYEVLYRCYEVLRSECVSTLESHLTHFTHQQNWQAVEAVLFAVRVLGMDVVKRSLLKNASPATLQNASRLSNKAMGLEISPEEVKQDADRTFNSLLSITALVVSLLLQHTPYTHTHTHTPHTPSLPPRVWVACVRGLSPMPQLLAKAQHTELTRQVCWALVRSLSAEHTCRPFVVEAIRILTNRCSAVLQDGSITGPMTEALHTCTLTPDDTHTLTSALMSLVCAHTHTHTHTDAHTHTHPHKDAVSGVGPVVDPLLQRLAAPQGRMDLLLRDLAMYATLLQRLPPTQGLSFLSSSLPSLRAIAHAPPPSSTHTPHTHTSSLASALLECMGRAALLPVSARAEAQRRQQRTSVTPDGMQPDGAVFIPGDGVLSAVVDVIGSAQLHTRAPEGFVRFVGQVVEGWGPTLDQGDGGLPGEAEAVTGLLAHVGAVVAEAAHDVEVLEAAVQAWSSALDMAPSLLLSDAPTPAHAHTHAHTHFLEQHFPCLCRWAVSYQTHEFAQSSMVLLTSLIDLPERMRGRAGWDDAHTATHAHTHVTRMCTRWSEAMQSVAAELTLGLLLGVLGGASEPILDPLCQLLRALILRLPDPSLGAVQQVVNKASAGSNGTSATSPTEQTLIHTLHTHTALPTRVLPLLRVCAQQDLSTFRDMGACVWAYCQGEKGQDVLDRFLRGGER